MQLTKLQCSDAYDWDYPCLSYDIKERAIELIEESRLLRQWDAKELAESIVYSLSCSQGDWVSFRKWRYTHTLTYWKNTKEIVFYIETNSYSNRYCHEKTFYVDYSDSWYYDFTDKEKEKMQNLADDYTEELRVICAKIEKYGYALIEREDEGNIIRGAFNRWKEENHIEDESELYDFSYSTEEKDGYTLIATDWDTSINGLYVKLPELKENTRQVNYFTF